MLQVTLWEIKYIAHILVSINYKLKKNLSKKCSKIVIINKKNFMMSFNNGTMVM